MLHAATAVIWRHAVQRLFKNVNSTQKHTIYSTVLQCCSFKWVILIQIRGYAVTYRSAVGHTVSRNVNSQARTKFELWNAAKCETFRTALRFRTDAFMNGSQWNKKCSVTAPLALVSATVASLKGGSRGLSRWLQFTNSTARCCQNLHTAPLKQHFESLETFFLNILEMLFWDMTLVLINRFYLSQKYLIPLKELHLYN